MEPKPAHLSGDYPLQFSDRSVARAYPHRASYPPAVFERLVELIAPSSRRVLDLGCGTGDIARGLAPLVEWVDAVDISAPMIARGQALSGGDAANLRWILGRAEDAPLEPPYALVTAGESLHWMDWETVLLRMARVLVPGGVLAIIERRGRQPWDAALRELIPRFSTNTDFAQFNLVDGLERRGLFTPLGEYETESIASPQLIADYIESIHSANGFSRDRMTAASAAAFDRELAALLAPYAEDGAIVRLTAANVRWGLPSA